MLPTNELTAQMRKTWTVDGGRDDYECLDCDWTEAHTNHLGTTPEAAIVGAENARDHVWTTHRDSARDVGHTVRITLSCWYRDGEFDQHARDFGVLGGELVDFPVPGQDAVHHGGDW